MVVERSSLQKQQMHQKHMKSECGQSLVEFMLMLPLIMGIAIMMVKVNTAIQVSIVNQKYSRLQVVALARNSPYYPSSRVRASLLESGSNRMTVGVSDQSTSGGGFIRPKATEIMVARNRKIASQASNDPGVTPTERANVRVRSTVTLCTANHAIEAGRAFESKLLGGPDSSPWARICWGNPQ